MNTDKEHATYLANELEAQGQGPLVEGSAARINAAALLRRWPDAGVVVAHQYLFDGYNGPVWRNDSGPWNGMQPKASRPLYTAPPAERIATHRAAVAVLADCNDVARERIAALEATNLDLLEALQAEQEWREREAAGAIDPEWDYEVMVGAKRRAAIAKATGGAA